MPGSTRKSRSNCSATCSGGAARDILDARAPFAGFRRVVRGYRPPPRRLLAETPICGLARCRLRLRRAACCRLLCAGRTRPRPHRGVMRSAAPATLTGASARCGAGVGKCRSEPRIEAEADRQDGDPQQPSAEIVQIDAGPVEARKPSRSCRPSLAAWRGLAHPGRPSRTKKPRLNGGASKEYK